MAVFKKGKKGTAASKTVTASKYYNASLKGKKEVAHPKNHEVYE